MDKYLLKLIFIKKEIFFSYDHFNHSNLIPSEEKSKSTCKNIENKTKIA